MSLPENNYSLTALLRHVHFVFQVSTGIVLISYVKLAALINAQLVQDPLLPALAV